MVRRQRREHLISKTSKRPYVDFFWINYALSDFWRGPWSSALLTAPARVLLVQKDAKAQVCELYGSVTAAEDVRGLYISVKYVFFVHSLYGQSDVPKAPSYEVLAQVAAVCLYYIFHWATLHIIEDNPDALGILVDFFTANKLLTVQNFDQICLINNLLPLLSIIWLSIFKSKLFFVRDPLDQKDISESSIANLFYSFIILLRVFCLDFA